VRNNGPSLVEPAVPSTDLDEPALFDVAPESGRR